MPSPKRAERIALAHENNFTILRLVAAILVIFAHAYPLSGSEAVDLFALATGKTFGWAAVSIFFSISGYLITKSLMRRPSLTRFALARSLRIFPALVTCIIATTVLLGLFVSTYEPREFFTNPQVARYVLGNLSLLDVRFVLPGVFEENAYGNAVNGSLWTLPMEVGCYIGAAILFTVGWRFRSYILPLLLGAMVLCYGLANVIPAIVGGETLRLSFAFGIGAAYAIWPIRVRLWHVFMATLAAAMVLKFEVGFAVPALCLSLATFVFWFAFNARALNRISESLPDWSYGIYIYAFPVQQTVEMLYPDLSIGAHFSVALFATCVPAALSWHLIESPALALKRYGGTRPDHAN